MTNTQLPFIWNENILIKRGHGGEKSKIFSYCYNQDSNKV